MRSEDPGWAGLGLGLEGALVTPVPLSELCSSAPSLCVPHAVVSKCHRGEKVEVWAGIKKSHTETEIPVISWGSRVGKMQYRTCVAVTISKVHASDFPLCFWLGLIWEAGLGSSLRIIYTFWKIWNYLFFFTADFIDLYYDSWG